MRFLDRPIVAYLIIFVASLAGAIVLAFLGGYSASVAGAEKETGLTISITGSLAGFVVILLFSLHAINRLDNVTRRNFHLTFFMKGKPKRFDPQDTTYQCTCVLFDENTGASRSVNVPIAFQLGYLTIQIFDVGEQDMVQIRITNGAGDVWESEHIPARRQKIDIASH